MNDAIILLAISQIVCLGGMAYLYLQVQGMSGRRPARQHVSSHRAQPIGRAIELEAPQPEHVRTRVAPAASPAPTPMMSNAYAAAATTGAPVANRMAELGVDVSTLARRMNKSEEEVKLMLRRQAVRQ